MPICLYGLFIQKEAAILILVHNDHRKFRHPESIYFGFLDVVHVVATLKNSEPMHKMFPESKKGILTRSLIGQ